MTLFRYDDTQRSEILGALPGVVRFGSHSATQEDIIGTLEKQADAYLKRKLMMTTEGIKDRLRSLTVVQALLHNPSDLSHRERIAREIDRWSFELAMIERPREHRARLQFMVEAMSLFTDADEADYPLVEHVALSDSNSAVRRFFDSAIAPVCEAAGEPFKIRAAINAFVGFKEEMLSAEINLIRGQIECAAKVNKT